MSRDDPPSSPTAALTMLDHFAERLSQHGDVARAAAQLGKSPSWGGTRLAELKRQLGPQAC